MTEKAYIQKIKDALTLAKQARVGCELTYVDVIELVGYIRDLEEYIEALEGYAKEDNWLNFEGHDVWQRDEPGSELATKALKGGGDACTPMTKF